MLDQKNIIYRNIQARLGKTSYIDMLNQEKYHNKNKHVRLGDMSNYRDG